LSTKAVAATQIGATSEICYLFTPVKAPKKKPKKKEVKAGYEL
jgi:hypothetical protein